MANKSGGISARDLLLQTFKLLTEQLGGREIQLPMEAKAEIANNSNWHRTHISYTGYESAVLAKIGDREWLLALGKACGSYPVESCDCDVFAWPFFCNGKPDEEVAVMACQDLERNLYYRKSLVFAGADGQLFVGNQSNPLGKKTLELLGPKINRFLVQGKLVLYRQEFVPVLADILKNVLVSLK